MIGTCHCGHHQDTHFEKTGMCLGVCDCNRFRDSERADPGNPKPMRWVVDESIETPRMGR